MNRRPSRTTRFKRRIIDVGLRFARVWWWLTRPLSVGVRAILLDEDGRVMLVRHGYGARSWYLPGGGVKRGELLTESLRREVLEETGLEITAMDAELGLLAAYSNFGQGKSDHVAVFVVEADGWRGDPGASGVEISRVRFVELAALPADTSPGTRSRLAEFAGQEDITYRW